MAIYFPNVFQERVNTSGFGYQMGDPTISTEMDIGPAKKRARMTKGIDTLTVSFDIKISEFEILQNFFKTTLNNGVNYFTYKHPFTQVEHEYRMPAPSFLPMGGQYLKVSMSWEQKL